MKLLYVLNTIQSSSTLSLFFILRAKGWLLELGSGRYIILGASALNLLGTGGWVHLVQPKMQNVDLNYLNWHETAQLRC